MAARPGRQRVPLVGRSAELSELLGLCAGAPGGSVLVAGPAGVGKTRLLDELAARVEASGTLVLRGSAVAGGGPYRPLAESLLRAAPPTLAEHERLVPFRAVLARLLPAWPAAPAAREYVVDPVLVLGEAVVELLRVAAADRRCVLLLDDLHWADRETLRLLEYLAPALDGEHVVLVGAARDDESSPVHALRRRLRVLPLRRLPDDDVATLARHCADGPLSDDVSRFLATAADGLPLLVEELFAGLVEDGRVRRDALGWHSAAPLAVRVPEAFADVVRQRLDRIPGEVRELVRTAAVLGGDPDWRLIAAASGAELGAVAAALPVAVDVGLFVDDGGSLRWRHALTRDAVWGALSPPERAHRCSAAAAALSPAPDDRLALVAGLWARGGAPGRAADLLLRLGRAQIDAGALAAAADTLADAADQTGLDATQNHPAARAAAHSATAAQAAAACANPTISAAAHAGPTSDATVHTDANTRTAARADHGDRADAIAAERVRALALGGRVDEALAIGQLAAARGSRPVAVQLARACVSAERWEPARRWLNRAASPEGGELPASTDIADPADRAAIADPADPTGHAAFGGPADPAVLALAAHVALAEGDRDEAVRLAAAAVADGERAGHVETVCEALEITGRAQRRADPAASRAAFVRGERLAGAHGLVPWRLRALAELGALDMVEAGDTDRLVEARRLAEECGMLGLAVGLDLQITANTFGSDGPVTALLLARRCVEQSTRLRLSGPATHAGMFVARGLFWAGEVRASDALFDELARTALDPTYVRSARAAVGGFAAWLGHDPVAAVASLGESVAQLRVSSVANAAPVWGHWALLATVVHPDDVAPLAELRASDLLVQSSNRAAVHYAEAVLAHRDGRADIAAELLARGDATLGRRRFERLLLRCLMLGADDAPGQLLQEAIAHCDPRGEVQLARWCRDRLRRAGRPVPRPTRDHTAVPERLRGLRATGCELEALRLVGSGSTNAEVAAHLHLSVRTVETNVVSNLLAKTGAADRGGLAAWLPT